MKLLLPLLLATVCLLNGGCCVKNFTAKPTITNVEEKDGKRTAGYGGEIAVNFEECAKDTFKAKWETLNATRDKLNAAYLAGKIPKDFYEAQVKQINHEINVVLMSQGDRPIASTDKPKGSAAFGNPAAYRGLTQEQLAGRLERAIGKVNENLANRGVVDNAR